MAVVVAAVVVEVVFAVNVVAVARLVCIFHLQEVGYDAWDNVTTTSSTENLYHKFKFR